MLSGLGQEWPRVGLLGKGRENQIKTCEVALPFAFLWLPLLAYWVEATGRMTYNWATCKWGRWCDLYCRSPPGKHHLSDDEAEVEDLKKSRFSSIFKSRIEPGKGANRGLPAYTFTL